MRVATFGSVLALSVAFAASSLTPLPTVTSAYAKGGDHGGGNSGGNGNRGGNGNGGGNSGQAKSGAGGSGDSSHGNSPSRTSETTEADTHGHQDRSIKDVKAASTDKQITGQMAGLNSLNRNYQALLHTSDPRMAKIAAYATAYARYELENGVSPAANDPFLGDDALEAALSSATKTGVVSHALLEQAKAILGVGAAFGKIDQIRGWLEQQSPNDTRRGNATVHSSLAHDRDS